MCDFPMLSSRVVYEADFIRIIQPQFKVCSFSLVEKHTKNSSFIALY